LSAKEMAFRANSQVKGVSLDADACPFILFPSRKPGLVDRAIVQGEFGLRRIRPGAPILVSTGGHGQADPTFLTLDGRPASDITDLDGGSTLIRQFCSSPLPRFETHATPPMMYHRLAGDELGLRSAVDIVVGSVKPGAMRLFREPNGKTHTGLIHVI